MIFHFRGIRVPQKILMATNEDPDKTQELQGIALNQKYVLAVPETSGAKLFLARLESSRLRR